LPNTELQSFRARADAYQADPPEGQKHPQYDGFFSAIVGLSSIGPSDRIGPVLKDSGITRPEHFSDDEKFLLDVELWQPSADMAQIFTHRVATRVKELNGTIISEYRGSSALLLRVEGSGRAIKGLIELPEVATVDPPPVPDLAPENLGELTIEQLPDASTPENGATVIGVIDSGVTSAHPMLKPVVVEAFGEPEGLGDTDEKGHGTPVAGIASYGDIREQLNAGTLNPKFYIASARVVNHAGTFDDRRLVPEQFESAIRRLHEIGCTVINISLGDMSRPAGNKAGPWAAILDDLARELDLVIVVSAGNADRTKLLKQYGDGIAGAYPNFLKHRSNRVLEPATGINVLSVGSLAHSNGLEEGDGEFVGIQPITREGQPSPFTRVGPGINGMIKPDLVDFGGTALFDGTIQNLVDGRNRSAAGVISLHNLYLQRLLTSVSGTSFSAPLVAFKAAMIRSSFPNMSANFTRALLALSAEYPEAAVNLLQSRADIVTVLGYGQPHVDSALFSDDNRVILFREDELPIDKFAIYEIPIPKAFQTEKGRRQIRVCLAYDPPVRHTRLDYAGIEMSFELVRGTTESDVFDHFRKWEKQEGKPFKVANNKRCKMHPGSRLRERGSLQCSTFRTMANVEHYGDTYFLAVRCEGGWASTKEEMKQRFAIVVELRHESNIELYQRVQERVRVRARV
jgi:hypothetical protein